ncbi:MAG: hypothetical protein NT105_23720 [Verrucomicrobia bacterium]|nr:hypothetical protein [Verrucomicrobiota bacterium]
MAATENRDVTRQAGESLDFPVAAAAHCYAGTMGAVNAAGNVAPAADTSGLKVRGTFVAEKNNTDGDAGDLVAVLDRRPQWMDNSGSNAVTVAELGKLVFVEDDQTVCKDGGTNKIVAGRALKVDATLGVLVDFSAAVPAPSAVTLGSANSEISDVTIGAPATITPQNTDGEIEAVALATETSSNGTAAGCSEVGPLATEAEKIGDDVRDVRAKFATLVGKCEDLAEDVILLDTALQTAATKTTVETLRTKLEELADDVRAIKAALNTQQITS